MDDDGTDWSDTIEFADGTKFALPHDDHTATGAVDVVEPSWTPAWDQIRVEGVVRGSDKVNDTVGGGGEKNMIEGIGSSGASGETPSFGVVSKEKRFEDEYYDRSWNSQRLGVPQIYNVNTGKFDVVDEAAKNIRRGSRRTNSETKPKTCHPVSLLSRHSPLNYMKKDGVPEIHEQKSAKPDNILDNDIKKKPLGLPKIILKTESKAEAKTELSGTHSSAQPLISVEETMNTVKPTLYQPAQIMNPIIDDIETFQRAVMIEAKEKAQLRREEEEIERKMQQERAKKKAEELAKLAQKSKPAEIEFSTEEKKDTTITKNSNVHSTHSSNILTDTSLVSSQQVSSVSTHELKISSKPIDGKKDKHNLFHLSAKIFPTHSQTFKNSVKLTKLDANVPLVSSESDSQVHNDLKLTLKKNLPIIFPEQHPSNEKEGKIAEAHKHHTHIDTKQKHPKISYTNNHPSFNDSWRKERITLNEKELHKTWVSLNNVELRESLNPPSIPLFSLEKKKLTVLTANKNSNKSSPSHSRTSSRFFPVTTQTEITTQSIEITKLEKSKNTLPSEHREKNDISLLSKTSFNTPTHSIQTSHSDIKPSIVILPPSSHVSQTVSTHSSGRLLNVKTVPTASTAPASVPSISAAPTSSTSAVSTASTALLMTQPGSNISQPSRHNIRPSTRSFDDVMEQLARAGNFAQNNEKFASYLSISKSQRNHIENDVLSVTTISPFELEKYPKNTTNVSLHSLNNSNELFMTVQPFINENDTKPFVNIPHASPYVFATRQYPMEQPKYFETPHEHTIDYALYDDQEVDTLRLYLPETTPKHIKIKSSNTFLHKKSSKNIQLPVYNTLSS
ncbi:unnamed protein product [Pneumocystis jirovecii]|uniref:Uncharacterized protein n=1 Tax=Pneumocystis jirovecii TaxID=42068 RepID=L0PFH0_PNEJI|nr:unnamed protein product [Pneumocystis jirovecii]